MAFKRVAGFGQAGVEPQPRQQPISQPRDIEQPGESLAGQGIRNVARQGVRSLPLLGSAINPALGAGLLGGELAQGFQNLTQAYVPQGLQDFLNATSGNISPSRIAQERGVSNPEQYQPANPLDYLPTGQNISRGLEPYLPEGYLQPQSEGEQVLDDFTTFAGSALNPIFGGAGKTLGQAATRGGLAAASGIAARGAGLSGLPETIVKTLSASAPELSKILTAPGKVAEDMTQKYNTADQIGQYVSVPGNGIKKSIDWSLALGRKLGSTPSSKVLIENGEKLLDLADKNGNYKASDLVAFKQSLNELYGKPAINKVINKINKPILEELAKVGERIPLFGESFFGAEESYKALNAVGRAQKLFNKIIPPSLNTGAAYYGVKQLLSGDFLGAGTTAAAAAIIKPLGKHAAKFYDFVEGSTQAQKIFGKMITNLANDSKEPAIRDFNHLNKLYEKDIKQEKRESNKKGNFKRVNPAELPF